MRNDEKTMNSSLTTGQICRYTAGLVAWMASLVFPVSAAYVIRTDGQRVDGSDIRLKPTGEVVLTTPRGQLSFNSGQYRQAVADKPAEYDKAAQLANNRKYDEAISLLTGLISRLRGLYWDEPAGALLMQCQIAKGDSAAAVKVYDSLVAGNPKLTGSASVQDAYRQALIAAKQFDRLEPLLKAALAGTSRSDAAHAWMVLGDMYAAQNRLEEAAMDYLRTALLFQDVKAEPELPAEALFKAGETLQKMKDERSAQHCFQAVVRLYPTSRAATQAGKK